MRKLLLAVSLLAAAPALAASKLPKDVAKFIARTEECHHWAGEEPYDKERAEFLKKAYEKSGCAKLDADEKRLRVKYEKRAQVVRAIDEAKAQNQ